MSELLLRHHAPDASGLVHRVTPESAGWTHVGFELWRLRPGQRVATATGEREACLVIVAGRADIAAGGQSWAGLGERGGPFEGKSPCSIYVPWHQGFAVTAVTDLELAVCWAPGGGSYPVRLVPPERSLHLENALQWLNDPTVTRCLEFNLGISRKQEGEFFDRIESPREGEFTWAILDETERHIGFISIQSLNWRHRSCSGGLLIGEPSAWGKGYAADAVRVRTRFAFDQLGLAGVFGPQHFYCDLALQHHVYAFEDGAHAAFAQLIGDPVISDYTAYHSVTSTTRVTGTGFSG